MGMSRHKPEHAVLIEFPAAWYCKIAYAWLSTKGHKSQIDRIDAKIESIESSLTMFYDLWSIWTLDESLWARAGAFDTNLTRRIHPPSPEALDQSPVRILTLCDCLVESLVKILALVKSIESIDRCKSHL